MKTAVLVSGVVRNMVNASANWNEIDGDFFLVVENEIYNSQCKDPFAMLVPNLDEILNKLSFNFSSINIRMDNKLENYPPEVYTHACLNMAWKWKWAYNIIQPYHQKTNYDKVMLLRPDMYLDFKQPVENFKNMQIKNNYIAATSGLFFNRQPPHNGELNVNDMFLCCNMVTLSILSTFFDYYLDFYHKTNKMPSVHTILAEFLIDNRITIDGDLGELINFTILYENTTDHMFENGKLKPEYSYNDLYVIKCEFDRQRRIQNGWE